MLKLATVQKKHIHYIYLFENAEEPIAECSENNGHKHLIEFDEATGQFMVLESEGHTHIIGDVVRRDVDLIPDEPDNDKVANLMEMYSFAYNNDRENLLNAKESDDFYNGDQWEKSVKELLESSGRAALTINEVGAKIDMLIGYQRQNRSDLKFYPVEDGDSQVAEILDYVCKNIMDNSEYQYEETSCASDEFIAGRGILNIYEDYSRSLEGDIIIESMPWSDIIFGPYMKIDMSDCEYLFKKKMFSKSKIKQLFPDKADKLEEDFNLIKKGIDIGDDLEHHVNRVYGKQYLINQGESVSFDLGNGDKEKMVDIKRQNYQIFECWQKVYRKAQVMSVLDDDFNEDVSDLPSYKSIDTIEGVELIEVNDEKMRVTEFCGGVVLSDKISETPYDGFDVVVAHAKFRKGKWWSPIHGVKDVQREINKRSSQSTEVVSKTASYGWIYDSDTFKTTADENNFLAQSSAPGYAIKCDRMDHKPELQQGVKFPSEIVQLENQATERLHRIMNIPMQMQGFQNNNGDISGRAIIEQRRQGLVANEYLFDNLNLAKKLLAKKLVALIQKVYTPERIVRLIRNSKMDNMRPPKILEQEDRAIIELLTNSDLTKYDVVVSQSPFSDTIRQANHQMLTELMMRGGPVPMEYWVQQSDLPDKEMLLMMLNQQKQAEQQQIQDKNNTEIQKTQIAAQSKIQGQQGNMPQGPQAGAPQ